MVLSFSVKNNQSQLTKFSTLFRIIGLVLAVIGVFSTMFKQIDAGKVGVKALYGNVEPDILRAGCMLLIRYWI